MRAAVTRLDRRTVLEVVKRGMGKRKKREEYNERTDDRWWGTGKMCRMGKTHSGTKVSMWIIEQTNRQTFNGGHDNS